MASRFRGGCRGRMNYVAVLAMSVTCEVIIMPSHPYLPAARAAVAFFMKFPSFPDLKRPLWKDSRIQRPL